MTNNVLDLFFKPSSVAIIGASDKANHIGRVLLENLKNGAYTGKIYPVNQKCAKILNYPAYPDIVKVGEPIDLAVIASPIRDVPEVLRKCGQAGVQAAIVISPSGKKLVSPAKKLK